MAQYAPGVPTRVIALVLIVLLTLTNLYSVRSYGEFEFWFASLKVVAIVLFIVVGFLFVFGVWPASLAESPGLANLYGAGGFAPSGAAPIFASIATAIFALVGAEVVSIASASCYCLLSVVVVLVAYTLCRRFGSSAPGTTTEPTKE